jgi:hypothetical protein
MTADQIVDRVRSVCISDPFGFIEAETWASFDLQPDTNVDGVFRIPPTSSQGVIGGFSYTEDRVDSLQVWVARKRNGDYDGVRRTLLKDVHSLTAAIVRDAHVQSGEYGVLDDGREHSISENSSVEYVTLRLTLPVNYEVQL